MGQRRGDGDPERDALQAAARRLAGSRTRSFEFALGRPHGHVRSISAPAASSRSSSAGARPCASRHRHYVSTDSGAIWKIQRSGEDWTVDVGGPLIAGGAPWSLHGIDSDTVEVESPAGWITASQLAHLVRDRAGRIVALEVSTGRIKKMRFERSD